jgi:hypothetical protein
MAANVLRKAREVFEVQTKGSLVCPWKPVPFTTKDGQECDAKDLLPPWTVLNFDPPFSYFASRPSKALKMMSTNA